ncbi:Ig-like domain repeat protein [uncultured Methanobrevibacter sp.]|uniref:Ig-like domain repeat protein n=1 Tax=uncultured Methanobrevibacter sp. TaxID=253161 RepID=UPI00320A237F
MESKNIIIILLVIIAILGLVAGVMFLQQTSAKEPTKIKITSNKTLYKGNNLSIKLTDLNKTPLSKEKVNITIKNSKGKIVVNKTLKTNDKGNAKLDLNLKKGKYNVTVSYSGNENYTGNNTTQKLTIKEKVVKAETSSSDTQDSSSSSDSESDGYWETSIDAPFEYHTEYDSSGGFRQYDRAGNLVGSSYVEDQDDIADYVPRRI